MEELDFSQTRSAELSGSWGLAPTSSPADRRKRRRRPYRQPGWVYRDEHVHEVQMRNISPDGAGFISSHAIRKGEKLHLKVGLGASRRARAAEVMYVRLRPDGLVEVGVRFAR